jgi:hypothetical protein
VEGGVYADIYGELNSICMEDIFGSLVGCAVLRRKLILVGSDCYSQCQVKLSRYKSWKEIELCLKP